MPADNNELKFVNLDADQQGHFSVLLTDRINSDTSRMTDIEADLVFHATMLGHVLDNKVDEKTLDYLTDLDNEQQ